MIERYKILEEIGRGGIGTTFLVYDNNLNQKKVLKKILFEGYASRNALEREIEALKKISHAGVPTITDTWIELDAGFIVMDYCPGDTLAAFVKSRGEIDEGIALGLFRKIVDIVLTLHSMNPRIIHGDLKPENIVVTATGVKLLDFGASYIDSGKGIWRNGNTDMIGYTPGYASVALREEGKYSIESDIYALGMILFFLITGKDVRSYPLKTVGVEDLPQEIDVRLADIFVNTISGYSHTLELMEDVDNYLKILETRKKKLIFTSKKELVYGKRKNLLYYIIRSFENLKNRKNYKRLESVLLTDGGKFLFGILLIMGLIGINVLPTKAGFEERNISAENNMTLPITLLNEEGERYILKEGCVFNTDEIPILEISNRMISKTGNYSICVILKDDKGNQYCRTILCHKN